MNHKMTVENLISTSAESREYVGTANSHREDYMRVGQAALLKLRDPDDIGKIGPLSFDQGDDFVKPRTKDPGGDLRNGCSRLSRSEHLHYLRPLWVRCERYHALWRAVAFGKCQSIRDVFGAMSPRSNEGRRQCRLILLAFIVAEIVTVELRDLMRSLSLLRRSERSYDVLETLILHAAGHVDRVQM